MGEHDPAVPARQAVGDQSVEPAGGVRTGDLDPGEGGDVHETHALPHRPDLFGDDVVHDVAPERIVVARGRAAAGEPARPFVTVHFLEHGARLLRPPVERRGLDGPSLQPVEVREGDLVAQAVVFPGLDHLPVPVGIGAEPPGIVFAHGNVGRAMDDPARQFARQPRSPADADLRSAAAPVVPHSRRRPDQRVAVGRMGNGAMDGAPDTEIAQHRHAFHGVGKPWHDPLVVRGEELVLRLPGTVVDPDGVRVLLLVDADETGFLLHPDIAGHEAVVAHHGKFPGEREKLRHGIGDEVVVRHRRHGKLETVPPADLPGVGAGGVDHVFADDVAPLAADVPFAAGEGLDARDPAAPDDPHTLAADRGGHGLNDARRVDMAVIGRVESPLHALDAVEGMQCADTVGPDQFHGETQRGADTECVTQPVHLVFGVGEAKGTAAVPCHPVTGFAFEGAGVEPDVVVDALSQAETRGRLRDLPGGVPGRT